MRVANKLLFFSILGGGIGMIRYVRYGVRYSHQAELAFVEVSSGIYKVAKSRTKLFEKGKYVETHQVVGALNSGDRVIVCKNSLEDIVSANFTTQGVHQ